MGEMRLEYKYTDKVDLQDLQMEEAFSRLLYFALLHYSELIGLLQ